MNNKKIFFQITFFGIFALILWQLLRILGLFLYPILWASVMTMVFYPWHRFFLKKSNYRKNIAAMMTTVTVIVLTLGPILFFASSLANEVSQLAGNISAWVRDDGYQTAWDTIMQSSWWGLWTGLHERLNQLHIEVLPLLSEALQSMSNYTVSGVQDLAKNSFFMLLTYLATMVIFFFFVRDGEGIVASFKTLIPMSEENKTVIFERLNYTVSAVVRGLVVTAVAQASLAGLAFLILGVPFPLLLSFIIGFLGIVPIGGAVFIWFPASIYLLLTGFLGKALILFIWGALVVSTVDNILKPWIIGEKTKIPTLFLFMSIIGGLATYGVIGVFLGPILLGLFLTLIEIYQKDYSV